ncbi:MAG: ABC transporter permease, partial [bacterium]
TRSALVMGLVIGVTAWPWTARAVRAQTASLKTREHIDIARISGFSTFEMIIGEILPYMFSYIFMAFILQFSGGILNEATLSMLGLGPYQTVSLGVMLHWSLLWEAVRTGAWWAFIPPVICLSMTTFSLMSMNASMDEIFNPRLRRG